MTGDIQNQADLISLFDQKENNLSFANGLTRTVDDIALGGTLANGTTLSAEEGATINFLTDIDNTDGIFFKASFTSSSPSSVAISTANIGIFIDEDNLFSVESGAGSGGLHVKDAVNQKGLQYVRNYENSFGVRSLIDKNYADNRIGGQTLNETVTAPTGTEDGYALTWNDIAGSYELTPSALALTNGSGTTANGSAVDLGGTLTSDVNIEGGANFTFTFGTGNTNLGTFGSAMFGEGSTIAENVGAALSVGEGVYVAAYGGTAFGRSTYAGGQYSQIGGWYAIGPVDPLVNLKTPRTGPSASASFGFYATDSNQTDNDGVNAAASAILGGYNHNIPSTSPRSVILGGNAIKADDSSPDTVFLPKVRIGRGNNATIPAGLGTDEVIVIDGTTGELKKVTQSGIGGGGGAFTAAVDTTISATSPVILDEATGDEIAYDLSYTVNKATSGKHTGIFVNVTDTASPATLNTLLDLQIGGISKFRVDEDDTNDSGFYFWQNRIGFDGPTGDDWLEMSPGNWFRVKINNGTRFEVRPEWLRYTSNPNEETAATNVVEFNTKELGATTAVEQNMFVINGTVTQSGTATGYTAFQMNVTENATVGTNYLMDLRVGGVSLFNISNTGAATADAFIKTGGLSTEFLKADGSVDTNTYLTGNQTITLTGDVTGSGTTSIATTIATGAVDIAMLSATGTPSSSTYLRGDNTWATVAGGGGITNDGAVNEVVKSDGTNVTGTGVFSSNIGDLVLGSASLAGDRKISVNSDSSTRTTLTLEHKGIVSNPGDVTVLGTSSESRFIVGSSTAGKFARINVNANDTDDSSINIGQTGSGNSRLSLTTTGTGDIHTYYFTTGRYYSLGVDQSDANSYKLTTSPSLSTLSPSGGTTIFKFGSDGLVTFNSNIGGGGTTNFLRADGVWTAPGDVFKDGNPANNQIGVWTGNGTIEGDPAFTFTNAVAPLLTITSSTSSVGFNVTTTSNTATHDAVINLSAGSNSGDSYTRYIITSSAEYSLGLDNTDNRFKLNYGTGGVTRPSDAGPLLSVSSVGEFIFNNSVGDGVIISGPNITGAGATNKDLNIFASGASASDTAGTITIAAGNAVSGIGGDVIIEPGSGGTDGVISLRGSDGTTEMEIRDGGVQLDTKFFITTRLNMDYETAIPVGTTAEMSLVRILTSAGTPTAGFGGFYNYHLNTTAGPTSSTQIGRFGWRWDIVDTRGEMFFANTAGQDMLVMQENRAIGFFGATPVVQPGDTGEATGFTAGAGTAVNDDSTFTGNVGARAYRINDIVKNLKNLGILQS